MKTIITTIVLLAGVSLSTSAQQVQFPKASPSAKLEQKVGVTDIKVKYSRPGKKGRVVFGDVVPFDEIWRTGANENSLFTTSDAIVFGKDTLAKGTYAIFTKPSKESWEILFYKDTTNWGDPEKWEESKVVLRTKAVVKTTNDVIETFTISVDNIENNSAFLNFGWDKTVASVQFIVPTTEKVMASITKLMAGPSAGDYYNAGNFYFKEKKDLKQALTWVSKAIEMQGEDAYWMLRTKSLIQAELGDKKGAIETAQKALKAAEKANSKSNIELNKASIEEWSKKK